MKCGWSRRASARSMSSRIARTRVTSIVSSVRARSSISSSQCRGRRHSRRSGQPGPNFGLVAVADGLQEQFAQRTILEGKLAEDVEDLAAQCLAFLVQLFQKPLVDLALARVLGDQVPEVADFGLADAVNAAEPLFQAVGIPGQVVVDHQVRALEVDAFAGGVGGDQDFDFLVLGEGFLGLAAFLAAHAAVDRDDGFGTPQERSECARRGSSACRDAR